jgi:hypothetical protein
MTSIPKYSAVGARWNHIGARGASAGTCNAPLARWVRYVRSGGVLRDLGASWSRLFGAERLFAAGGRRVRSIEEKLS